MNGPKIINTGGGGFVYGDGGVAYGATINVQAPAEAAQLSKADLAALVGALGALKAALIGAGGADGAAWAGRVSDLERSTIDNCGRLAVAEARRLLAQIRYVALGDARVADAVAQVTPHLPRRAKPSDVFISYKREERRRVQPMVDALRTLGVSVWIDDELTPGDAFAAEICDEIDQCRAQIVCWSNAAVASDWVRGEAEIGRKRGVLVCVQLEPCRLHPPFNVLHSEDLSAWRGEAGHHGWRKVLETLAHRLGRPALARGERG